MDCSIVVGDVVVLISGGPLMTVAKLSKDKDNEDQALCVWFDGDGRITRMVHYFSP